MLCCCGQVWVQPSTRHDAWYSCLHWDFLILCCKQYGLNQDPKTLAPLPFLLPILLCTGLGVTRVVVGRELSVREIAKVAANTGTEVEAFCHGALCVSYSGQCFSSGDS